jgi:peptidoglycan/LPS O-acetylase OafA/YrhL
LTLGAVLRGTLWFTSISPALSDPNDLAFENLFDKIIYYPSYNRLDGLLVGVVIALIFAFLPSFKKRLDQSPNWPALVGLIFLGLGIGLATHRTSFWATVLVFPVVSLGFGGLVMSAALPRSALNRIHIPGAATMASLAYPFYLTHKELIHLFHPLLKPFPLFSNSNVIGIANFLICLAGAQILHLAVEQPFLRYRDDLLLNGFKKKKRSLDRLTPSSYSAHPNP